MDDIITIQEIVAIASAVHNALRVNIDIWILSDKPCEQDSVGYVNHAVQIDISA